MATFTIDENFGTYQGQTSYIIDGNESNCWRCDAQQGNGKYVKLISDKKIHVTSVKYSTTQTSECFSGGAYLQVSLDDSNWTDIGQFTGNASLTFTLDNDCQYIRIYCKSGNSYVSISELKIVYTEISDRKYDITVQSDGVEVDNNGTASVVEGGVFELTINGAINTITDNGENVKDKLVSHSSNPTDKLSSYPKSYTTSGSISGTRYKNCIGKGSSTTATGNDYSSGDSNSTATITYSFDFSQLPLDAIIQSIEVKVGGHAENASRSTATLQLYSGSTAKGGQSKFTSTSKQVITMTPGTWTRDELQDAKLRFTIGYYGGLVNGVDFNIVYSTPNSGTTYYTYKIDSVKESHEILINISAGENSTNLRIKIGSNWKNVLKAYQKVDGKWIEINVDSLNKTAKYVRIT